MAVTAFVLDIETDGPNFLKHSMFWFGVVALTESLSERFEGRLRPKTDEWDPVALAVSGKSRDEIMHWPDPKSEMERFRDWLRAHTRPGTGVQMWSDNNTYDIGWLNLYSDLYLDERILGHSSRNIADRHRGLVEGMRASGVHVPNIIKRSFKGLRKTVHDHNPVNDAAGNAEALLALRKFGLKVPVVQ